ncbi:MAG TPA: PilZ domain-containing protein [Phycisphaerales bacterium]|nr:PilZ domain-containing protein [Phycisphaerales bacterium]
MMTEPYNQPNAEERRDKGRVQCSELRSNVGEIVDASSTGLRIKGKLPGGTRPGTNLMINITSDEDVLSLVSEVRWIKKQAFRGMVFGVSFIEITENQRRQLWSMIRSGNIITNCSRIGIAA